MLMISVKETRLTLQEHYNDNDLIKYESYIRIFQIHYHTSFLNLIFSVASVTPYKLTYLVCPLQEL
jgi:hypothetical protein